MTLNASFCKTENYTLYLFIYTPFMLKITPINYICVPIQGA